MVAWLNCVTIDMIGELAFSEDFGNLSAGVLQTRLQKLFTTIKHFAFLKELLRLPKIVSKVVTAVLAAAVLGNRVKIANVGAEVSATRRARKEVGRPDFMSYMLRKSDSPHARWASCFRSQL